MRCETCDTTMSTRTTTAASPHACELAGLPEVRLVGVRVHRCARCGEEVAAIPRIEDLHRQLAKLVETAPAPLSGEEIRFLRKLGGFAAGTFAAMLGVTASTLSRVERGKQRLGSTADRFVRLVSALTAKDPEAAASLVRALAEDALGGVPTRVRRGPEKPPPRILRFGPRGWTPLPVSAAKGIWKPRPRSSPSAAKGVSRRGADRRRAVGAPRVVTDFPRDS